MKTILKVLVGSKAHGLDTPLSDWDYRGVFVTPTADLLALRGDKAKTTTWIEGDVDDTSWELGHFLHLATHCNPTILETFLSPVQEADENGLELRELFPKVWNSKGVRAAFVGYGMNQRKKFLEDKDGRPNKFAAAYLRSLFAGWQLLTDGTFTVRVADTEVGELVRRFKNGEYESKGEVIDACERWEKRLNGAYERNPSRETDIASVNAFLLKVRKENFL
jgi:predicted nucleotidyltransferase